MSKKSLNLIEEVKNIIKNSGSSRSSFISSQSSNADDQDPNKQQPFNNIFK